MVRQQPRRDARSAGIELAPPNSGLLQRRLAARPSDDATADPGEVHSSSCIHASGSGRKMNMRRLGRAFAAMAATVALALTLSLGVCPRQANATPITASGVVATMRVFAYGPGGVGGHAFIVIDSLVSRSYVVGVYSLSAKTEVSMEALINAVLSPGRRAG